MQKRGLFFILISLFVLAISLVSAQFGYGYGSFSIADFFNSVDPATITYGVLFFIFLILINLTLSKLRIFKGQNGQPNTAASGIMSIAISVLIVYYMYRSGYGFENFFYELGFSFNSFPNFTIIALVILAIIVILIFKLAGFFIVSGLFFSLAALFTDIIYERETSLIIGIILIIIGVFLFIRARRRTRARHP